MEAITFKLSKFQTSFANGLSHEQCLRRWSEFIRDVMDAGAWTAIRAARISAYHICRTSFLVETRMPASTRART